MRHRRPIDWPTLAWFAAPARSRRCLVAAVVVWVVSSVACSPTRTSEPGSPGESAPGGGSLVSSVRAEPRSFNRLVATDATTNLISHLTHARLVRVNQVTQEWEPWLIESWSASDDGLSYVLVLRDDITFSDGHPFSSADLVFTFEAVYDEATASPLGDSMRVGGEPLEVAAVDDLTVEVRFPSPFGPGLRLLDNLPVLPRHRLEPALRAGTLAEAWGLTTPPEELAGLGPFVLSAYEPGQRMVFSRNPSYWRRDDAGARLPYLDRLVVQIIPDQNAEVLRLETGDLDLIATGIRPEDYAALKRAEAEGRLTLVDLGWGSIRAFSGSTSTPTRRPATRDGPGCRASISDGRSLTPSTGRSSPTRCSSAPACRCTVR